MSVELTITVLDCEGSVVGTFKRVVKNHVTAVSRYEDTYRHEALATFKKNVAPELITDWLSCARGTTTIGGIFVSSNPDFFGGGNGVRVTNIIASKNLGDSEPTIALSHCHGVTFGIVYN